MNSDLSICFYFPYLEDSGVPVLFYRIANEIAQSNPKIKISIIDYEGGVMWRNVLNLGNIIKIKFEDKVHISPPSNSILVMQPIIPYYWPKELVLDEKQKLFFWNLHPQNLTPSFLPFPFLRNLQFTKFWVYKSASVFFPNLLSRLRTFVNTLVYHDALVFMDKTNLEFTEKYLFLEIGKRDYLPVPAVISYESKHVNKKSVHAVVHFCWIGRLCDFKSHILVYSILKLNEIANHFLEKKFEFHIVGDGPFLNYIKKKLRNCTNVDIKFYGSIPHQQIDDFLSNNVDILMAMGTSALEGAKLGIPTFLLDISTNSISNDYVFRMLYDTKEYDLGHYIDKSDFFENNTTLINYLKDIFYDYELHSKKSFEYFLSNHHIGSVKNLFIEKVNKSTLTYEMIDKKVFEQVSIIKLFNKLRDLYM